jgi:ABC-type sugar transport system substrate-binding protein
MEVRKVGHLLAAASLLSVMAGCGTAASTGGSSGTTLANSTIRVGFSLPTMQGSIYEAFEDYMVKAAQDYTQKTGRKIDFIFTVAHDSAATQASQVQDLIAQHPNVLILMPVDNESILASIQAAQRAGIPVMTYNRNAAPSKTIHAPFVGLNTYQEAYIATKAFASILKKDHIKPVCVDVEGALDDQVALSRIAGYNAAAAKYGIHTLESIPTNWEPSEAESGLEAALTAHPNINCVFVASDFLMPGVEAALKAVGRWAPSGQPHHMMLASQDGFPLGIQLLKANYENVQAGYNIMGMSQAAIQMVVRLADHKPLPSQNVLVPPVLLYPSTVNSTPNLWGVNPTAGVAAGTTNG